MIDLKHGDCMSLMQDIPDHSVDMVLTDLPYGLTKNAWDKIIPLPELWAQYHRICKENAAIVLHCMQPFTSRLIMSNIDEYKYCWYWDKHLKTGFLNAKKQPLRQVEEIAVFYRRQPCYHPPVTRCGTHAVCRPTHTQSTNYGQQQRLGLTRMTNNYCATTLISNYPKSPVPGGHPTQKPVPLLEYLIQTYTDTGDTVLDNCMGSGSTGVAAVITGRSFIGIELDNNYFSMASQRISQAQKSKNV